MRRVHCSRRRFGLALVGTALAPSAASVAAAETVEITILDYKFNPAQLTIKAGTTVKWINAEKRTTHSVLFSGPGGFESERFFPGESWQRSFDKPGSYPYGCGPHPEMKGLIEVTP
jgi:plastocyanin